MVVLHGIPNRWQGMLQLIGPLAQSWHVFACDMRGHGKSGRCSSYRAIDYAEDVAAFVANRIGSPTVLLGHSGGAMAVLGAAAIRPDLARAVVLLDPPLAQATSSDWPKSTSDFIEGVCRIIEGRRTAQDVLAETLPGITDVQVRWFADTFSCVDLGVLSTLIEGRLFESFDVKALLQQLECPTLMLHGDTDKGGLVRDVDVELLMAHAQHGSTVRIRDTGHFLHAQKPQEILAAVEVWSKSHHLVESL